MAIMHLSKENFTCPIEEISLYLSVQNNFHFPKQYETRDQARGRLGRIGHPGGRNFALIGTQGEVGVSLKKKKKKKFFFFFLGRLIFILSPHKCKLW